METKYSQSKTDVESELSERILNLMKSAQSLSKSGFQIYTGKDKKKFVMDQLKFHLGKELYERYEPFIGITIDIIKQIAKDKNILKGLKTVKYKCFSSCV